MSTQTTLGTVRLCNDFISKKEVKATRDIHVVT